MALTQKEREVCSAPEGQCVPIHLPQHRIIIPNHRRRRRAFVGFLHQEQHERERKKTKQIKKEKEKDVVFPVNMVALLYSFYSSSLSRGGGDQKVI